MPKLGADAVLMPKPKALAPAGPKPGALVAPMPKDGPGALPKAGPELPPKPGAGPPKGLAVELPKGKWPCGVPKVDCASWLPKAVVGAVNGPAAAEVVALLPNAMGAGEAC